MPDAQYFRAQAELCLEIARQMSQSRDAERLRADAARYHARAAEIEEEGRTTLPGEARLDK
jgi:hypothetical protein